MSNQSRAYAYFYLIGRQEEELLDCEADEAALAVRVLDGEPLRDVTLEVATGAAAELAHGSHKREWFSEYAEEVTEAGGDREKAYKSYLSGRVDELAHDLESSTIECMLEIIDGEDDLGDADDEPVSNPDDDESSEEDDAKGELSLQARYNAWESKGWKDGELDPRPVRALDAAPMENQDWATAAPQLLAVRIVAKVEADKTGISSRKTWLVNHQAEVETDGVIWNKAYKRWCDGWREGAIQSVESEIVARRAQ